MKKIKKHLGAILFISSILSVNFILWFIQMKTSYMNSGTITTSIFGSTLLMGFFIVFLLSTRMKWLVSMFGGLDTLYFWHRILAIGTTAMIFLHALTSVNNIASYQTSFIILGSAAEAGEVARNGFILLIIIALLAKFIKYEHFRFIHRLLIIPYVFALYHGFFSSWMNLFSLNVLSIWMLATSIIGLGSSLYMLLMYQTSAFYNKGIIVGKKQLNDNIVELKVKMKKEFRFKAGQFAFIKIDAKGMSPASHPFSISGKDGEYIYFTIKSLGDYTKSINENLDIPARINITKPYGSMTFNSKSKRQVWIAGGIGLTPFLGFLRNGLHQDHSPIHLYYSVRNESEAIYVDYLNSLAIQMEQFKFTLCDTSKSGYLKTDDLDLDENTTVYMCGPRPMVLSLRKQIGKQYPGVDIHYEAFSFTGTLIESVLNTGKKVIRKLIPSQ